MQTTGIDTLELLIKLQAFALGNDPDAMSDAQVTAALGLLDREMPSLVEVEVRVCEANPVGVGQRVASKIEER